MDKIVFRHVGFVLSFFDDFELDLYQTYCVGFKSSIVVTIERAILVHEMSIDISWSLKKELYIK